MLDIDAFKNVNETYGDDIGDIVLKELAQILKKRSRKTDKVYRLGDEEFLINLHNCGQYQAVNLAEEIRTTVAAHKFNNELSLTVSIGVASWHTDQSWKEWLHSCDQNLYYAKNTGRNKVSTLPYNGSPHSRDS